VLGNEVSFEHRSPKPEDEIRVGMVDLKNSDTWIELGATHAWNWQQGCMLQWLPGSKPEVMWNARQGDQFVCHILDTRSGKQRTLPSPVYTVSPDGRWGLSPDFRRLNDMRPGYGYAGIPDPYRNEIAPNNAGIWKTDMRTGESKLLFSFAQIAALKGRQTLVQPFAGFAQRQKVYLPASVARREGRHQFRDAYVNRKHGRR
jgi:hypothetical protein